MKVCPQCRSTYPDDLQFCKTDGSDLVPIPPDTPATASSKAPKTAVIAAIVIGIFVLLIGGGALLRSVQSSKVASEPSDSVATRDAPKEMPSAMPTQAAESADPMTGALSEVKRIYAESDAAYGRRDVQAHMAYLAPDWVYIDNDGKRESRASSERYMTDRFSGSSPRKLLESHLETTVQEGVRFDGEELVVPISVVAHIRDAKGNRVISVIQEDRWRKINGDWKCIRTRVTKRF